MKVFFILLLFVVSNTFAFAQSEYAFPLKSQQKAYNKYKKATWKDLEKKHGSEYKKENVAFIPTIWVEVDSFDCKEKEMIFQVEKYIHNKHLRNRDDRLGFFWEITAYSISDTNSIAIREIPGYVIEEENLSRLLKHAFNHNCKYFFMSHGPFLLYGISSNSIYVYLDYYNMAQPLKALTWDEYRQTEEFKRANECNSERLKFKEKQNHDFK